MIDRREILDTATRLSLNPHIVEKDFVLGWILAGINAHDALAQSWIFKGGTCLKKCFFETYRFSEDLDFTLTDPAHLDESFLRRVFGEIAEWVYETSGVELPAGTQDFEIFANSRGNLSCQGKLSYLGPISPRSKSGGMPRIKLDLTADERIVLPPVTVPIFHPYSDAPAEGINILAYAYEEAFGEKVRALCERTRPRDLYDVVSLFRNAEARPAPAVLLDVLRQKCAFKGIAVPRLADLEPHRPNLEGGWANMLEHQLPSLPPLESFWNEMPAFFAWLEGGAAPAVLTAYTGGVGEVVLRDRVLRLPVAGQSFVEIIRFAAANRLAVELDYQGSTRRIEPYSLRRTSAGEIILHAHNIDKNEHRSYRIDRITGARTTNQTFTPRFEIELTPQGPVRIAPSTARISAGVPVRTSHRPGARTATRWARPASGPTYVFQCPSCGRKFSKKRMEARLNPHKSKTGYPCPGRFGVYVDTRY